jgi:hypothetical protein
LDRRVREIAPDEPNKRIEGFTDYHVHGLDNILRRIRKLTNHQPKTAARLSLILWRYLIGIAKEDNGSSLRGSLEWKRPHRRISENDSFDAFFIERLRQEPWLPDRKNQFRCPKDMRENELPARFERATLLCRALGFKTPLSETLKGAGISLRACQ